MQIQNITRSSDISTGQESNESKTNVCGDLYVIKKTDA